jgi:hypothetical protein
LVFSIIFTTIKIKSMKKEKLEIKPPVQKRPYQKPELKKFGSVRDLTLQSGSGGGGDDCEECGE